MCRAILPSLQFERKHDRRINLLARLPDFSGVCPVGHDRISLRDVLIDAEVRVGLGTEKRIEVGLNPGAPFLRACVWNRRRAGTVKFAISRAIVKNRGEISTSEGGKQGLGGNDVLLLFMAASWGPYRTRKSSR
jgi:hypothetical protein